MNWSDERYVRLYTRNTADWLAMRWEARALFCLLLREADRAGVVQVGEGEKRARRVAGLVQMPADIVSIALADLLADGCIVESELGYTFRNYIQAQEAAQSDAQRQRESRATRKALGMRRLHCNDVMDEWVGDDPRKVTVCDPISSQVVTNGHSQSQGVTPCLAVPCQAVSKETSVADSAPVPATSPKPKREKPPPAPGWKELIAGLKEDFELIFPGTEYQPHPADFAQLARLRKGVPDDVLRRVWRYALRSNDWPKTRTFRSLYSHFNHLQPSALSVDGTDNRRAQLLSVDRPRGA